MSKAYDYLIVGCGLFGATCARLLTDAGKRVIVIDKRSHIGGNCATTIIPPLSPLGKGGSRGIIVHRYGPHAFHTNDPAIWAFVNRFAEFNNYQYRPKITSRGKVYPFPINRLTCEMMGTTIPPLPPLSKGGGRRPRDFRSAAIAAMGQDLYGRFYEGYTRKQWGRDPADLPASMLCRVPIRDSYNDNYFDDAYQGIPIRGYTAMFEKMLGLFPRQDGEKGALLGISGVGGIKVILRTNLLDMSALSDKSDLFERVIYTGKIDEYFGYRFGDLEYRGLEFITRALPVADHQGTAVINWPDAEIPFTRSIEHRYFACAAKTAGCETTNTVVSWEFPKSAGRTDIPFYPVPTPENLKRFERYHKEALKLRKRGVFFGGRLGSYRYMNMDETIIAAHELVRNIEA